VAVNLDKTKKETRSNNMNAKWLTTLFIALVLSLGWSVAWSAQPPALPANATFTTLVGTQLIVEGLTGDGVYLYGAGRQIATNNGQACPVYRVNLSGTPVLETVGFIPDADGPGPNLCNPAGVAFDSLGFLYVAESATQATVYRLIPNAMTPPTGVPYATTVPGANGIAFKGSDLWISDGTQNRGRVWKVGNGGGDCTVGAEVNCEEVFRIQPMSNGSALGGQSLGVGRVNSTLQPNNNPLPNPQNLVANGLAFNLQGDLLVADTARGALWLVTFDKSGNLVSKLGCDTTFDPKTLCLENLFRADPRLEGVDGIALDNSGNIWASVNERNAIVHTVFFGTSNSVEVFRNPVNSSGLRNSATNTADNNRILEFPTSPFLSGTKFCTANSDGDRRDNSPASAGEIPDGTFRGKISCMDQSLTSSGLPLPRP
jgi:hypothetical protein